ncbi:class I SAM-dependent methyltransferase, partial [Campylobacter jejuni]|nr:class I SAM-dependent methyltransferase [Campylobacter jejuni]
QKYLNLYDFEVITSENINIKNKVYIKDSDIVIYGKIK